MAESIGEMAGPLCAGDRLPSISLPRAVDGEGVGWRRQGRNSVVVVLLSKSKPEAAIRYVNALRGAVDGFRLWDARVLVIAPAAIAESESLEHFEQDSVPVLLDDGNELRTRCGISAGDSAVFVADRFGEIYHAETTHSAEELPDPAKIQDWLKYLGTQCAECGVPDEPGYGEWA